MSKDDSIISYSMQVVNNATGEIETQQAYLQNNKISNSKRGWTKMYRIEYDLVAREMTSRLEYDIMTYIRDSNVPRTTILNFRISKIVKDLKTTRNTVFKVIKKLRDLNFIKKVENTYYMNPKMYVPPMIKDDDLSRFQEEWESLND